MLLLCFVQLYLYVALQDKRYDGHGQKKLNKKGPPCLLAVKNRNKKKSIKFMIRPKPKLLTVIHAALISLCVFVSVSKIKENTYKKCLDFSIKYSKDKEN